MAQVIQYSKQFELDLNGAAPVVAPTNPPSPKKRGRPLGRKDQQPRNRRGQGRREKPPANRAALTEWYIERVKSPRKGRIDIWDTRQPNFGARISASAPGQPPNKVFIVSYQDARGRRVIDAIGACTTMGLHEAKRIASVMLRKARQGVDGTNPQYNGDPFVACTTTEAPREQLSLKPGDAIDRHLEWIRQNRAPGTWKNRITMFRHHIRAWAEKFESVREISQEDVFGLFDSKPADLSNAVLNNIYVAIKAWFKHMHRVERIIDYNVTMGIGQPREVSQRERWLSDDEIRWFWLACTAEGYPHGDMFKLLLLTAQRPNEVREMPTSELVSYYDRREWSLGKVRTKSRRDHIVPISDLAAEVIDAALARGGKEYVFIKRRGQPPGNAHAPRVRVARLMEAYRAQELLRQGKNPNEGSIAPWDLRDLRRTAATIMARLKHPLHIVDKILNHGGGHTGTGRTHSLVTRVYVKYEYLEERRAALQELGEYIRKLVRLRSAKRS